MNNIVALVLTYNRLELLKEAIEALLVQTSPCDILVVDNASTDGTKDMVMAYVNMYNRVQYVNTGANLGGAGGFAFGIKECVKQGYEYIWLMDDDTIPYSSALEELVIAKNDLKGEFGFLSSLVEWTDGNMCEMNKPLVLDEWWNYGAQISKGRLAIKKGSFVSFFISTKTVKEVGLPIKEFFIWFDDSEYSRRIVERGYVGYLVSSSKVLHKMKNNSKVDIVTESGERLQRYWMAFRNRYYLNKGNGKKQLLKYYLYLLKTICNILKYSEDKKGERIIIVLKGTCDGIKFTPKIERVDD